MLTSWLLTGYYHMRMVVLGVLVRYRVPVQAMSQPPFQRFHALARVIHQVNTVVPWTQYYRVHTNTLTAPLEHFFIHVLALNTLALAIEELPLRFSLTTLSLLDVPQVLAYGRLSSFAGSNVL
jgi:hypothetical protein